MNIKRSSSLMLRHFYLIRSSFPRIFDLIYWPTVQIILWGFVSKFFTMHSDYFNNVAGVILTAAILYDFLFRSSISYNMLSNFGGAFVYKALGKQVGKQILKTGVHRASVLVGVH